MSLTTTQVGARQARPSVGVAMALLLSAVWTANSGCARPPGEIDPVVAGATVERAWAEANGSRAKVCIVARAPESATFRDRLRALPGTRNDRWTERGRATSATVRLLEDGGFEACVAGPGVRAPKGRWDLTALLEDGRLAGVGVLSFDEIEGASIAVDFDAPREQVARRLEGSPLQTVVHRSSDGQTTIGSPESTLGLYFVDGAYAEESGSTPTGSRSNLSLIVTER